LFGRPSIHFGGFSAHRGAIAALLDWFSNFKKTHPRLFLVHGENNAKIALQNSTYASAGWSPKIPTKNQSIFILKENLRKGDGGGRPACMG